MLDPMQRDEGGKGEEEPHKPTYFRGFFDAEKRRKVVNQDPTVGQAIGGAMMMAVPIGLIVYLVMRRRTRLATEAASGKGPKDGGFFGQMQKAMQQAMNPMGQKDFKVTVKDTKFKDVIGVPEALAEVQQYVNFLKTPEIFTRLGARLPKGCILTGEPGTGKTLLAKAVAGEADVPFFSCSGADFIEVYAGSGPKRVRELFAGAKKEAPSVIFIDEIDAVGSRSSGNGALGLSSEENRTINQLLAELDGLEASEAVVVFAATNFMESLDKALLREGRFDRKVDIPMPDKAARCDLFQHYLSRITCDDAPALSRRLAELTPGVSPATIAAIVNEGALSAAIHDKPTVTAVDLLPAIDDVLVGKKHRNRMQAAAAQRTALHESGHTLVAWLLPEQPDVVKVSIVPRGAAGGFTQQVGREVLDMPTEFSLFTDICVMLGGRLAEMTQHSSLTTGAQDDYQRATQTAVREFLAFGMSRQVGLLSYEPQRLSEGRMYQKHSEKAQKLAEEEAALLVSAATEYVKSLLKAHDAVLRKLAAALFEKKELLREDVEAIVGPRPGSSSTISAETRAALRRFSTASEEAALRRSTSRDALFTPATA
ncbi:ATP-dependent zinc metallopeptidase putativemetallo-peptidase Clan MA(E) Family M41 [Leptomonas pyrrhocoris]|uniref:ATP-dependent zinc metallopeptidase putativemetallo-peptidase Clan MA(E) Family M41 n=1 Tax=Leptomonas pyrrhocoris TaxID=157538 RepID=A0A0N0DXG7_LEPPY|nr:ATP-dependent zinc metallopeptidase putativemetallo-peptidase Clan MA(E) Family M41 [Leptomonas pyrrhocoris]KPA82932.1 ATP-dependent zinc metallopeptidase putativemetallo-peptidase Clan MA(E) Family M41 [Leptomonas pyrrhocoris]|eukprot:XP_015661371.1 ATP-dependent zinc metallopeptidase putativemetallo-peptidase Clan MA(E) Family M41 [Leptomonas pyrrhocoris]